MAEQEACTDLVDKASREASSGATSTFDGESQLLPLLQGLLEAPIDATEQTAGDSGTESGEDHQRHGLIAEVQSALDKLSASLKNDPADIAPERRTSLLQLVTKLQAGLAQSAPSMERRSSQGRFSTRRRQRPNRHTVGVSSEELADARRLIEEISSPSASILMKQNSEGSVPSNRNFKLSAVKNTTPKPFSSSSSSSVQTPTDLSDHFNFLFNEHQEEDTVRKKDDLDLTRDISLRSVHQVVNQVKSETETDDDSTVKAHEDDALPHQPDLVTMQNNPIYNQEASPEPQPLTNRFNTNKKLRMKRANTIDIPKPLNFYEDDDDSDCSEPTDEDFAQRRRSNYLALRGPIRMGNTNGTRNQMPVFEAKTDNDKKFLAFINKHNEGASNKSSLWSKPADGNVWTNKFGNIKTTYEKVTQPSQNSARSFWKSADDAVTSTPSNYGPKISRQSARNLQKMFEEKQKQKQEHEHIVTGSLKVKQFTPQPLPVNKFSHAPQSAFQPLPKKLPGPIQIPKTIVKSEINKDPGSPLYLYSPKPNLETPAKTWNQSSGESRVLSLAAAKFENAAATAQLDPKPKKFTKERVMVPPTFRQQPAEKPPEKLTAPYLVKTVENKGNTVRKLSDQYDSIGAKNEAFNTYSTVKYASPQPKQQFPPQGYYPNQQQYDGYQQYPPYPDQYRYQQPQYNNIQQQQQQQQQQHYANQQPYGQYQPQQYGNQQQHYTSQQQYGGQQQQYGNQQQQYGNQQQQRYIQPQYGSPEYQNRQYSSKSQQYSPQIMSPQTESSSNHTSSPQILSPDIHSPPYTPQYDQHDQYTHASYNSPRPQHYEPQYSSNTQYTTQYQEPQYAPQNASQYKAPPQYIAQAQQQHTPRQYTQQQYAPQYTPQNQQQYTPHYTSKAQSKTPQTPPALSRVQQYASQIQQNDTKPVTPKPQRYDSPQYMSKSNFTPQSPLSQRTQPQFPSTQKPQPHYPSTQKPQPQYPSNQKTQPPSPLSQKTEPQYPKARQSTKAKDEAVPKEEVYTSTMQYKQTAAEIPKYESQVSVESLKEYNAINSRVMSGPVAQQAVTTRQKSPMTRGEHDMGIALGIKSSLQKATSPAKEAVEPKKKTPPKESPPKVVSPKSFAYRPRDEPPKMVSPRSFSYKSRQSDEIDDEGVLTSKFHIPVINVATPQSPQPPSLEKVMSKAESWNQVCMATQPSHKPSPRASPNARTVTKSKSSHTLALPKQFEAGMSKDEMSTKRKALEAFLGAGGGSKSPNPLSKSSSNEAIKETKVVKRSINRHKTSEKVAAYRHSTTSTSSSSGLCRSRTLPDIICPELLDENNVDKAFDDLFKASS